MTNVRVSPSILDYRQAMAALVDRVCDETSLDPREDLEKLYPSRRDVLELWTPGLLFPPQVESLYTDLRLEDGHLDGLVLIGTSAYYGVMNVYVTLEDEQGNRLESGYALDNELMRNHWCYFPSAPAREGMLVIVRAIALDGLGGLGIQAERVMLSLEAELCC